MKRVLDFCGAFNGRMVMRKGETPEEARERAEKYMQAALDRVKSFIEIGVGVDTDVSVIEPSDAPFSGVAVLKEDE